MSRALENPFGDVLHAPPQQGLLVRASDIRVEPARFLWDPYAPLTALMIIAGIGGLGKSHLGIELAARATRGQLKGDLSGEPVGAIIATAEDALAQTMVPRLIAAGADLERVSFVRVAERGFSVPDDLPALSEAMAREGARFVLLDPLVAFLPIRLDSHKDQHARIALAPLAALAQLHEATLTAILHLNKAADAGAFFLRVSGSVGFLNAARSALLVAEDPEDDSRRVVAHAKHNLTEPGSSLKFKIEGTTIEADGAAVRTSRLVWLGESGYRVDELLGSDRRGDARRAAEGFLEDALCDGPVPVTEIRGAAAAAGLSWRTVERAKSDLSVVASKSGFQGAWVWQLPSPPVKDGQPETWRPLDDGTHESAGQAKDRHMPDEKWRSSEEQDFLIEPEPGWRHVQRDAGEEPERDEAGALARVTQMLSAKESR